MKSMDYLIHPLLDESKSKSLVLKLLSNKSSWQSGKATAGSNAAKVKNNMQLDKDSNLSLTYGKEIIDLILVNQLLKSFCLPKLIHGVMFSKTSKDGGYGAHIDNAYMSSGRSDLSFSLFLTNPNEYEGGELCIQTIQGSKEIKLQAGEIIIYPSTSIHSVNKVTRGERLACIGWIESYISSNEDRITLFSLDAAARGLLANHGQSEQLDLIFQSYNNLLRRLGT